MAQINGPQRAKVVRVDDPNGLLRVTVRLLGVWDGIPDADLPWAERLKPDNGAFIPLIAGDDVWVDFPYGGDSKRPRVCGQASDSPGGVPNSAPEASGQGAAYEQKAVDGAPDAGKITPSKDYVLDRNGLLEIRNASGSWSLTHKASGSTLGMNDSGHLYICSQQALFLHSVAELTIQSESDIKIKTPGTLSVEAAHVAMDPI